MVARISTVLIVSVLISSCIPFGNQSKKTNDAATVQVSPMVGGHSPQTWLDPLPKILTISPEGHKIVKNMALDTRKRLMILAENTARKNRHQFSPFTLRYLDHRDKDLKFQFVANQTLTQGQQQNAEKTLKRLVESRTPSSFPIFVHPETQTHHPVSAQLIEGGAQLRGTSHTLWPTMSRSLWIWPAEGLYTIKLPTDTINGTFQPQKLSVENDSVSFFVPQINAFNSLVTSAFLRQEGIIILPDAAGYTLSLPHQRGSSYGVILRDYSPLLEHRSHIFIPQHTVTAGHQFFSFQGRRVMGIALDGGVGARTSALDGQGDYHRLLFNFEQWSSLYDQLEIKAQKLHALFLSQGYHYAYHNFHGQNVLFGISLEPGSRPHLVLRDIADVADLIDEKSVAPFKGLDLGLQDLHRANVWPSYGCHNNARSHEFRKKKIEETYLKSLEELGFRLPAGYAWDQVTSKGDLEKILVNPLHREHFFAEMRRHRKKSL